MKIATIRSKEFLILESLAYKNNSSTGRYLKNMHENFVIPYVTYLSKFAKRLNEADLSADQVNQLFQSISQDIQSSGSNETMLGKMLPDAIKKKFADSLPAADAGEVQGFDQQANTLVGQVQDPAIKKSLAQLIKTGLTNPITQKLIIAGVQGIAGVAASAWTVLAMPPVGALGATAAGAITGALIGIVSAKLQGKDWKSAGMSGAALGGAGGALGGNMASADATLDTATSSSAEPATTTPTQQPLEIPVELKAGNDAADLKAAQEYAVADQAEKAEIRNVTGLSDAQLTQIIAPKNTPTESIAQIASVTMLVDRDLTVRMWALNENLGKRKGGVQLTEAGVKDVVNSVKSWLKTKGQNITQKVTPDKLMQAWTKAGKPTDSEKVYQFLQNQEIPIEIIDRIYSTLKIPTAGNDTAATPAATGGGGAFGSMASQLGQTTPTAAEPTAAEPTAATPTAAATGGGSAFGSMASQLRQTTPTAAEPTAATPAATGGSAFGSMASQLGQTTPTAAEPAPATGTVFDNPTKLLADFNEYIKSGGTISAEVKTALKDALSTKFNIVENKKRKFNRMINEAKRIDLEIKKIKKNKV